MLINAVHPNALEAVDKPIEVPFVQDGSIRKRAADHIEIEVVSVFRVTVRCFWKTWMVRITTYYCVLHARIL